MAQATNDITNLGIQEIDHLVTCGQVTPAQAFAIVEARIAKRMAEKRPQVARVVAYRNELARQLGHAEMPMPAYGSKPAVKGPSVSAGQDIERLADDIAASGIDISALLGALAKRMSASPVSG